MKIPMDKSLFDLTKKEKKLYDNALYHDIHFIINTVLVVILFVGLLLYACLFSEGDLPTSIVIVVAITSFILAIRYYFICKNVRKKLSK